MNPIHIIAGKALDRAAEMGFVDGGVELSLVGKELDSLRVASAGAMSRVTDVSIIIL